MTTTWHADDDLLVAYAAGRADDVLASSVEAHLLACDACRSRLARHVPQVRLASNWEAVVVALDAPRVGLVERLLVGVGLSPGTTRRPFNSPIRVSKSSSRVIVLQTVPAAEAPGWGAFTINEG